MREPNFFIVGAAKSGTTSLFHYLDQHPDIYMSPLKEPTYFSFELRPESFAPEQTTQLIQDTRRYIRGPMKEQRDSGIVCDWQDYLKLFAAATTQRAVGEASVAYLWSATAAREIAARMPRARIIMILRAPTTRAFSAYTYGVSNGTLTQSFSEYLQACLNSKDEPGIHKPSLEVGLYADQVQRYLDHFPSEQIGIWIYEENKGRQKEFVREVFEFLGVDGDFEPDLSKHYLEPHIPRMMKSSHALQQMGITKLLKRIVPPALKPLVKKASYRPKDSTTLSPEDKALLQDFYRHDIQRLEKILNRDLSIWLA